MMNFEFNLKNDSFRKILILIITILIHLIILLTVTIEFNQSKKRDENMVFKMVDVREYIPPEPKNEKEEEPVEINKQDDVVEDIIATDKEIKEVDIDYLPQHKISEIPVLPSKEIRSRIVYPPLANRQGIEGIVYLELFIDQKGNIKKIEVLKDPGYGFAEAAINALKDLKCSPAKANGIPVAVRFRYPIRFTLK